MAWHNFSKEEKEHFMDTLEAFKNKGYISIAEEKSRADAEIARLRELLHKNGIDFSI